MIGVDTNILVRYVLDDDPVWSPAAARFIDETLSSDNVGFVNVVTLAEFAWTLKREASFNRDALAVVIESFLESDKNVLGHADIVQKALTRFKIGNAGFADYLIAELNLDSGAERTMTIDKRAARNEAFEQLSPGA